MPSWRWPTGLRHDEATAAPRGMTVRLPALLLPLTPLYAAAVRTRAAAYRRGWIGSHRATVPVISVGNLTFGGTGKTPTVIALVRDLVRRGRRPAVLTRGYGRSETAPRVAIGPDERLDAAELGDEPVELANRLPGVPIIVDRDRVQGAAEAVRRQADILLLDDGFQHLRLERDLDLVLVDAGDPFGGDHLPPLGRLREPPTALARATAVLVTKLPPDRPEMFDNLRHRIRAYAPQVPVIGSTLAVSRVRIDDVWQAPGVMAGARVMAFAGLGRPEAFADVLAGAGAEVVGRRWFADHHRYTETELSELATAAQEVGARLVTTAKDAVKLPPGTAWEVEAEVVPVDGSWDPLWRVRPEVLE